MLKKIIPIILAMCLILSVSAMAENETPANDNNSQPMQEMPMQVREKPQGETTGNQMPQGDFTPLQNNKETVLQEQDSSMNENNQDANNVPENVMESNSQNENESAWQNRQFPGDMKDRVPGNMQNNNQQSLETEPMTFSGFIKTYSTPITSVILLALAFVFVIFYKRKNY